MRPAPGSALTRITRMTTRLVLHVIEQDALMGEFNGGRGAPGGPRTNASTGPTFRTVHGGVAARCAGTGRVDKQQRRRPSPRHESRGSRAERNPILGQRIPRPRNQAGAAGLLPDKACCFVRSLWAAPSRRTRARLRRLTGYELMMRSAREGAVPGIDGHAPVVGACRGRAGHGNALDEADECDRGGEVERPVLLAPAALDSERVQEVCGLLRRGGRGTLRSYLTSAARLAVFWAGSPSPSSNGEARR